MPRLPHFSRTPILALACQLSVFAAHAGPLAEAEKRALAAVASQSQAALDAAPPPPIPSLGPARDARTGAPPVLRVVPWVRELSGSVRDPRGSLWTHGDSGTGSRVARTTLSTLETRTVEIRGASNRDWEAMALSEDGELWVLDTGDNHRWRSSVNVQSLGSPSGEPGAVLEVARSIVFTYPDGPQNVEAGFIRGGRLYLVQRRERGGAARIYRVDVSSGAPSRQKAELTGAIEPVGPITDASLSPSGGLYLLTYRAVYRVPGWEPAPAGREGSSPAPAELVAGGRHWGQAESLVALGDADFLIGREDGLLFRWKDGGFVESWDPSGRDSTRN